MYQIEKLANSHNKTAFDCGKGSLNNFLFSLARQNARKDLSKTYVAIDSETDDRAVLGYYSISCGSITFQELPDPENIPSEYPIPTILLARLARDLRAPGLGTTLLLDSYKKAVEIADIAGAHVFEVDAMDEAAKVFYEKYGFLPLTDNPYHLIQTMKDIRKIVASMGI